MLSGDCNVCINGKMSAYSATCVECGLSRKNYKPTTNADKLRSMSDEELAVILAKITEPNKLPMFHGLFMNGEKDVWLDWLREEATE